MRSLKEPTLGSLVPRLYFERYKSSVHGDVFRVTVRVMGQKELDLARSLEPDVTVREGRSYVFHWTNDRARGLIEALGPRAEAKYRAWLRGTASE